MNRKLFYIAATRVDSGFHVMRLGEYIFSDTGETDVDVYSPKLEVTE